MKGRWLGIGLFWGVCLFVYHTCSIRWNLTESLPYKVFLGSTLFSEYKVGDVISFKHPKFQAPLAKIIVGVPGDKVSVKDGSIYVKSINRGKVLLEKHPPIQNQTIPHGHFFVWTEHPESFDSRYQPIGLIKQEDILEKLWPLF